MKIKNMLVNISCMHGSFGRVPGSSENMDESLGFFRSLVALLRLQGQLLTMVINHRNESWDDPPSRKQKPIPFTVWCSIIKIHETCPRRLHSGTETEARYDWTPRHILSVTSRWWFQTFLIFIPLLWEMMQFDEHIFQMGWFNHQPDLYFLKLRFFFEDKPNLSTNQTYLRMG